MLARKLDPQAPCVATISLTSGRSARIISASLMFEGGVLDVEHGPLRPADPFADGRQLAPRRRIPGLRSSGQRELQPERRALAHLALDADVAVHRLDQAFAQREPKPGSPWKRFAETRRYLPRPGLARSRPTGTQD
jgi:hypothetical protein